MEQLLPVDAADLLSTTQSAMRLRAIVAELAQRRCEALSLYEPLPNQANFHKSNARVRLLRGSNRGGKTLPAAVEVARAVTGSDPFGKYPSGGGRAYCIAKDLRALGEVMWPKLGKAGAFKMIRDLETGLWRAFRPWQDESRVAEAKRVPPLIPPRLIEGRISWISKASNQPKLVKLKNGWEISFFSSEGKPPQGMDIDLWWIDEEVMNREWYPEMSARILDRTGRGIWSATPQARTDQLFDLHERADKAKLEKDKRPAVEEFVIRLSDNPHVSEEAKQALREDITDDDDYKVRVEGEFTVPHFRVYPEFKESLHCIDIMDIPNEWCRYMVVDPGHQVCAVLFAAVPPPPNKGVYLYDELYLRECDAIKFAENVANKAAGKNFQAFLIDYHFGIHTEVGSGKTVMEQYSAALKEKGVRSLTTGSRFQLANDDVDAGLLAVHAWMRPGENNVPILRVMKEMMPAWLYEVKRYYKRRVDGKTIDKPNQKKNNHLMDCTRYLAMHGARYVQPKKGDAGTEGAIKAYRDKVKKKEDGRGPGSIRLGPGRTKVHAY